MGDGRDGDVGRDDGVRDAGVPGHHAHANGEVRAGAGAAVRPSDGRATRLLPVAEDGGAGATAALVGVQPDVSAGQSDGKGAPTEVRLGRGDTGGGAVGVLLRLHTHACARRCAVPEVRREAHHGLRHTMHGHIHADDTVCGTHRVQAAVYPAIRRRTW